MAHIRAQVTTRSGPPGTKDTPTIVHGEFTLDGARPSREFLEVLGSCLEAARGVAQDGMVTEVAVLVFADVLATAKEQGAGRGQG